MRAMDESLLHDVVAASLRAGADAAEAVGAERRALSVASRDGELEEVEREESRDLSLRVFVGRRQANVSGSDFSKAAVQRLIERAVAMSRLAPEDPYAGLVAAERLARGPFPDLDVFDAAEPSAGDLEESARRADAVARAFPGVTNTDGGAASWSAGAYRHVTSEGFSGATRSSWFSLSASAIAGEGAGMERGGEGRTTRHLADLPSPEAIGEEGARRAVAKLDPRKIGSTTAPVLFDNRNSTTLIGPFLGAISGPSVARGTSFLKDRLGQAVFSSLVTLTDDPFRVRGLASSAWDDEGAPTSVRRLVDAGVLTTWLLNLAAARQLGMETTGHASRSGAGPAGVSTHNLTLEPGPDSPQALMRAAGGRGLQVTSMFGPSLNANTGDWSAGVSGVWWESGEPAYPVTEITVAGSLPDIYARLIPANDLEIRGATNAPSIMVDGLAIAGK